MAQDRGGARSANVGSRSQSRTSANTGRQQGASVPIRQAPARISTPSIPWPAPKPAPYYPPPQQNYAPAPATPSFGIGAPTGGGMGGSPAPAPQVRPVISEGDWLKGDSTYQNQLSEYGSTLNDFLARLATQKNDFEADYKTSKDGLGRNQEQGMLSVGEDFTSRGMANSGLFQDARAKTESNYGRQGQALDTARTRAIGDFTNQETDKRQASRKAQENAKSASLGRMAQDQMFK